MSVYRFINQYDAQIIGLRMGWSGFEKVFAIAVGESYSNKKELNQLHHYINVIRTRT